MFSPKPLNLPEFLGSVAPEIVRDAGRCPVILSATKTWTMLCCAATFLYFLNYLNRMLNGKKSMLIQGVLAISQS